MSGPRDVVDELWGRNPLLALRAIFDDQGVFFIRKLRRAIARRGREADEGPLQLPERVDEAEIVGAMRAWMAAARLRQQAMEQLNKQSDTLDCSHDEHLSLLDKVSERFGCDVAQVELLTLALDFHRATETDKRLFLQAREIIERRLAAYLVAADKPAMSTCEDDLLTRLIGRRPLSRLWPRSRSPQSSQALVTEAVHRALILERAIGAGISDAEAEAQDRARWA